MEIDIASLIVPAVAGLIVGFCVGYMVGTKKSVPVKILQDLIALVMNFVKAVADGKLTQDEKNTLIQNITGLISDIKQQLNGGGTTYPPVTAAEEKKEGDS